MGNLIQYLLQDLRFTFRQLGRAPGFFATAALTLALGIGVNTAIFSLVDALLLRPLPVASPQQITELALAQNHGPQLPLFSWPEYRAVRAQTQSSFSGVAVNATGLDGFATNGLQPQRILTSYVSGNFFSVLGLKPAAGRLFLPSEGEVLGSDPIVVLDYDFWMQRFNGDASVVGRSATIDGHPLTIVGVAPKGFHGVQTFVSVGAYLPISQLAINGTPTAALSDWQNRGFILYARLRPGVTLAQADAELNVAARDMMRQQPEVEKNLVLAAFSEPAMRIPTGDPKTMYIMAGLFLSLAGMVLLLACVNVANLVLVRATTREREMAIRTALGARRSRLLAQLVTESVTLALIGGAMGIVLGVWSSSVLGHIDPHADLPVRLAFDFDWRVFLYSFSIALAAGIIVGVVPSIKMARSNVNTILHEGSRGIARGRNWFRDGLVALQIAGSLVLLVVTGLFVRSLSAMQTMDLGFRPDHVLNLAADANEIGMTAAQARDLANSVNARLHQIAGVEAVSNASQVPLGYLGNGGDTMIIDGQPAPTDAAAFGAGYNVVSPEYFLAMGMDFVRGRAFAPSDDAHGRDVAIVSESAAKKYWPGQDAIGHTFRMGSEKNRKLEVVGIVRDAEFQIFGGAKTRPFFYLPYAQHFEGNTLMVFQLRTSGDPLALAQTVEKAIHSLAPELPLFQVQTMRQGLYTLNGLLLFQIGAALAAVMGGLGLTLAVIGLYGVVSYSVGRRVHEIGLRMALGATRASVFGMIYRQSMVIVAIGLGLGLALALLAAKAAGSFVIVNVWDPLTYAVVALALAVAALGACYLPARRAMAVEPMTALRED